MGAAVPAVAKVLAALFVRRIVVPAAGGVAMAAVVVIVIMTAGLLAPLVARIRASVVVAVVAMKVAAVLAAAVAMEVVAAVARVVVATVWIFQHVQEQSQAGLQFLTSMEKGLREAIGSYLVLVRSFLMVWLMRLQNMVK